MVVKVLFHWCHCVAPVTKQLLCVALDTDVHMSCCFSGLAEEEEDAGEAIPAAEAGAGSYLVQN